MHLFSMRLIANSAAVTASNQTARGSHRTTHFRLAAFIISSAYSCAALMAAATLCTGCGDGGSNSDSTKSEATRKKNRKSSKTATAASASAKPSPKPKKTPKDPLLAKLVGDDKGSPLLDRAASLPAAGLSWRLPRGWITTEAWSSEETKGGERIRSMPSKNKFRGMAIEAPTEEDMKNFAGGKPYPMVGDQPYGGKLKQGKWTPFTALSFGRSQIDALATHGEMRGTRYIYVVFRAPKGGKALQLQLTWGDNEREAVIAMARSVGLE